MTSYKLGTEFPHEGFVQRAIDTHFQSLGFVMGSKGHVDLVCDHPTTRERWIIEAKGETSDVGLDFRTGLGQLIQAMDEDAAKYGMAIPDTPKFRFQLSKVPTRVRQVLGLHWVLVAESGAVQVLHHTELVE